MKLEWLKGKFPAFTWERFFWTMLVIALASPMLLAFLWTHGVRCFEGYPPQWRYSSFALFLLAVYGLVTFAGVKLGLPKPASDKHKKRSMGRIRQFPFWGRGTTP